MWDKDAMGRIDTLPRRQAQTLIPEIECDPPARPRPTAETNKRHSFTAQELGPEAGNDYFWQNLAALYRGHGICDLVLGSDGTAGCQNCCDNIW